MAQDRRPVRFALRFALAAVVLLGIATVAAADQTITWVSVTPDGSVNGAVAGPSGVSDDGRFVAFESNTNGLVPGDSNGHSDIFVKDMPNGRTGDRQCLFRWGHW